MPVNDGVSAAETIVGEEVVVKFEARSVVATGVDEVNRLCDEVRKIGCIRQCLFRASIIAYMHVCFDICVQACMHCKSSME